MKIGIIGSGNIGANAARLFVRAGHDRFSSEAKEIVARLIEEIGFVAVDTGFLHDGGRSQQPGTAVYNKELTAREAGALLSAA